MIAFELFDKIISAIKEQDEVDEQVSKAMELLCDSWVMMNSKNKRYAVLSELLTEVMQDKGDWIGWWLYEDVKKEAFLKNNKKVDLSTTKQLYDFLVNATKK